MPNITYRRGDAVKALLNKEVGYLLHCCNGQGVMRKTLDMTINIGGNVNESSVDMEEQAIYNLKVDIVMILNESSVSVEDSLHGLYIVTPDEGDLEERLEDFLNKYSSDDKPSLGKLLQSLNEVAAEANVNRTEFGSTTVTVCEQDVFDLIDKFIEEVSEKGVDKEVSNPHDHTSYFKHMGVMHRVEGGEKFETEVPRRTKVTWEPYTFEGLSKGEDITIKSKGLINNNEEKTMRRKVKVQLWDLDKNVDVESSLVAEYEVTTEDDDNTTVQTILLDKDVADDINIHNGYRTGTVTQKVLENTGSGVTLQKVKLKQLTWKVVPC